MSFSLSRMNSETNEGLELPAEGCGVACENGSATLVPIDAPFAFEAVKVDGRPSLLVEQRGEAELSVNGLDAPPIAVLRAGDVVRLGSTSPAYEVVFKSRAWVGMATADMTGKTCAFCRTAVQGHRVVVCGCGAILHHDQPATAERLECASLSRVCPSCEKPLLENDHAQ